MSLMRWKMITKKNWRYKMNHKDVDKIGKLVVDGMMLALLWAIIALPVSTFSLVRLDKSGGNEVLSAEDVRIIEENENRSFRPGPVEDGTEQVIETVEVIEIVEQ